MDTLMHPWDLHTCNCPRGYMYRHENLHTDVSMAHAEPTLNFVLSPFILVFIVIYFFIKNAEKFHKNPVQLGNRQWSQYALWRSGSTTKRSPLNVGALWV